jgi:hypothetical protein
MVQKFCVPGYFTLSCGKYFTKDHIAFLDCWTLKMKPWLSIKMLGITCPMTHCHIPEDLNLSIMRCEVFTLVNSKITFVCECDAIQSGG